MNWKIQKLVFFSFRHLDNKAKRLPRGIRMTASEWNSVMNWCPITVQLPNSCHSRSLKDTSFHNNFTSSYLGSYGVFIDTLGGLWICEWVNVNKKPFKFLYNSLSVHYLLQLYREDAVHQPGRLEEDVMRWDEMYCFVLL